MISLLTGAAKPDLLQIITTDSGPIITRCSARLTSSFMHSWVKASEEDAGILAGDRPAGHELCLDAAGGRPRCGR